MASSEYKSSPPFFKDREYWNWWRIICGAWLAFVVLYFLGLLVLWLVDGVVYMDFTGMQRWQMLLLTISPIWTMVALFSMAGEAPPGMM